MSIPFAGRASVFHRSLAAQAVLLVVIVTAATAALVGSLAARRMAASLISELDRRGSSLATMLERHKDLHGAALRRDAAGAEQVLQLVVSSDAEMEYAGLLDSHGALIAAAARDGAEAAGTVRSQLRNHPLDTPGLANADTRIRRFTQAVAADEGEKGIWAGADERLYNPGTTIGYVVLGMRDRGAVLARDQAAVTVAGVGTALAGAFLVYFLALARRLRRILRFAEQLAARNLAADLPDRSPDEVGRVAEALRGMRDRTREVVSDLAAAADALRASSAAMHENALAQRERAEGQAARVTEIDSTMVKLERSSRLARDGAQQVIEEASRSGRDVEDGRRAVVESTEAVEGLRREVVGTADALRRLSGQSARTGEIARTVADLAERSHLVAINTAIEAARTGEEGKAFRIVAHEMRELADGSRQATGRVRTMLLDIARSAESSRSAAESGHERSDTAVERARAAAQVIERLAATLASFVQAASRIAASATEQANAIQAISAGMSEVRAEAEGAALRVAAMEAASHDILRRAERLQAVIDGYPRGPGASHAPASGASGPERRRGFAAEPAVLEGQLSVEEP